MHNDPEQLPNHIPAALRNCFAAQRKAFAAQRNAGLHQRREDLHALHRMLVDNREALVAAVNQDFGCRSRYETLMTELLQGQEAALDAIKQLPRWMKKQKRSLDAIQYPLACAYVVPQPLGVIGIVVPWNFPIAMAVQPMIGALAAGNRVMVKMSENSAHLARLLQQILPRYFAADKVSLFADAGDDGQSIGPLFTQLPFNHLFFTGSAQTGKAVMANCAANLTPVTLELGGKSPAIVSADVPLKDAAERIAFGKALNAGQTCVAPDYVLVPEDRVEGFVEAYSKAVRGFYPTLADNPDYTAIINERQLARLNAYAKDATDKGATLIPLYEQGQARRMAHSLLLNVSDDMTVMQDEIFGPLLPIVPYRGLDQAFAYINQRPRPLALYYFGYNKGEQARVLHETHSGGVCLNDTLLHVAQDDMPFGGIGPSGMGHYHGHEGFLTFSKAKGVLVKQRLNAAKLIYPPYGKSIQKLIQKLFIR